MSDEGGFLSRWSRLKRSGGAAPAEAKMPAASRAAVSTPGLAPGAAAAPPAAPVALPTVESLEPGADISLFMRAEVEQGLKRQAFKKLLEDPRYNVMDGLDVYIADFSQSDPLPAGWLEKMNQSVRLGDYKPPEEPAEGTAEEAQPVQVAAAPPEPETREPDAASDTSDDAAPASRPEESGHRD